MIGHKEAGIARERCNVCGKGCAKNNPNRILAGKLTNMEFNVVLKSELTCEKVYIPVESEVHYAR